MDKQAFYSLFRENITLNGLNIYITENIMPQFYELTCRMMEKNAVMNITAIREVEKIIPLHYADCMAIAQYIPQNAQVMDVGCGGGFPTLPLAIIRPDIQITAIDSTEKKVNYVQETADAMGLRVHTLAARAEELARDPAYRERFDVVTSRAVARLNLLDELCLPFLKVDGQAVIMKGAAGDQEVAEAQSGILTLGGQIKHVINNQLALSEQEKEQRTVVLIKKVSETPAKYPRPFGQIKKKPL